MLDKLIQIVKGASGSQVDNETLVKIATFFYKVDGRISLEEQDYITQLLADLEWTSHVDIEVFQQRVISEVNQVLDGPVEEYTRYLARLMDSFQTPEAISRAKDIAKEIADADGEVADAEVESLAFIANY